MLRRFIDRALSTLITTFIVGALAAGTMSVGEIYKAAAQTNQQKQIILFGSCPGTIRLAGAPCPAVNLNFATGRAWVQGQGYVPFTNLLSISRASTGYATTSSGLLVPFAANTLRITDLGLLVEEARTNVALWSRDLTNAAWTASNVTVALNQTGADGTANAASSLTATAGNGTVLQAITLGSSARAQSAYVKRLTGSGVINMTMDNGATWAAIVPTASYTQLTIPTQTLANPTIGFRIVTNGDAIAVDFVNNENGAFSTSPIPTTTTSVLRNADVITIIGAAAPILSSTQGTVFVQTSSLKTTAGNPYNSIVGRTSGNGHHIIAMESSITNSSIYSGPAFATATFGSGNFSGTAKVAAQWYPGNVAIVANNGTIATNANTFNNSGATYFLGYDGGADPSANGYIQRLSVWNYNLPSPILKALTQ